MFNFKGVDIINGEYPPGVFLRGLKFLAEEIRGLKFLGENLRGHKLISEFDLNFSKSPCFLVDTDSIIANIIEIFE